MKRAKSATVFKQKSRSAPPTTNGCRSCRVAHKASTGGTNHCDSPAAAPSKFSSTAGGSTANSEIGFVRSRHLAGFTSFSAFDMKELQHIPIFTKPFRSGPSALHRTTPMKHFDWPRLAQLELMLSLLAVGFFFFLKCIYHDSLAMADNWWSNSKFRRSLSKHSIAHITEAMAWHWPV